jgi:hypothetical protein
VANPADTSQLVFTPSGIYHRSCVWAVPDKGVVDKDGIIRGIDGTVVSHAPCVHPGPYSWDSPEVAKSPWRVQGKAQSLGPRISSDYRPTSYVYQTINHDYVESAGAWSSSGHVYRQIYADFTAPAKPASYSSGEVLFIFPALQNNNSSGTRSIAQPVLQLGDNNYKSPGNNWIGSLYVCQATCYVGANTVSVTAGASLSGIVSLSNCSAGKCDVYVEFDNNSTLASLSMTLQRGVPTNGQTSDTYDLAIASLEVANISACKQLPTGPIYFTSVTRYNELGNQELAGC